MRLFFRFWGGLKRFGFFFVLYLISRGIALFQRDLKRLIAFISVLHITSVFVLFSIRYRRGYSLNFLMLLGHRATSALFFILAGELYYQNKTRSILLSFRALTKRGAVLFLVAAGLLLLNLGVPPVLGFVYEVGLVAVFLAARKINGGALFLVFVVGLLVLVKIFMRGGLGAKGGQKEKAPAGVYNLCWGAVVRLWWPAFVYFCAIRPVEL